MGRFAFLLFVLCGLSSGCSNYKLAAINDARRYALDKYPNFSEKTIHQIKFTKPEIQQKIIFNQESTGSKFDFAQTCIVWKLDDLDDKSLIIVGFGERQLRDWYPIRAIIRRYRKINDEKKNPNKVQRIARKDKVMKRKSQRKRVSK
jgi:hypothetical protein